MSAPEWEIWSKTESLEQQDDSKITIIADAVSHSDSSSHTDEFDIDQFRNSAAGKPVSKIANSHNNFHQSIIQSGQACKQEIIKVLGYELLVKHLKERHKDPIFLLKTIAFFFFVGSLLQFGLMVVGSGFDVALSFIACTSIILSGLMNIIILKHSAENGVNIEFKYMPYHISAIVAYTAMIIYCFMVKTPFDSMPFFLLGLLLTAFFFTITVACGTIKNNTPQSDSNYQLKFFVKRILLGVLNATGIIDVLSDIALGVEIIQLYRGFLRYIGIVMFIFCILDFVIVNIRSFAPQKVTMSMHLWAIVLETIIIIVSILAAVKVDKENIEWEFIQLLVFSFVSTMINYLHHIFVVVEWRAAIRRQDKVVTFREVFDRD
eukprot:TRINITY_DN3236_c0_g1_i1.p1 TRINITY_DN3236_c0_g1~~TRINITY_DN3236_c0_g1_i1.p1  ORF type:complete len:377 (+),score=17.04 TRINITY_DN3236_c0_g1_i1:241-1371(+)